tara:strand:- start:9791 stop:10336 length:546 start_codon:yes stop_codon:yes gene_type:complete
LLGFIILPVTYYINFNYSSTYTYEKRYFTVKKNDPSFFKEISLNKKPIINSKTLELYIKESVVDIFNYSPTVINDHLDNVEDYFTEVGFNSFGETIRYVAEIEAERGMVLKKTVVTDGPFLLGTAKVLGGQRLWKYVLSTTELQKGLGGSESKRRSVVIILKELKFSKNKKGVAIDSIQVK